MAIWIPEREAKLPKWARDELACLRQDLASARASLTAATTHGPHDTDTIANPYAEQINRTPIYLPRGSTVQFKMDVNLPGHYRDEWVNVRVAENKGDMPTLEVNGGRWFMIRPKSANLIQIAFEED